MFTMRALAILLLGLQTATSAGADAPVVGDTTGLDFVPAECRNDSRQPVAVDNLIIFHNKVIVFPVNGVTLRSELFRDRVRVRYSDENGEAVFRVPELIRYPVRDVRTYHATLDGRAVVLWEETVENVAGRAGILEYRGRGLFPLCDGLVRTNDHERHRLNP